MANSTVVEIDRIPAAGVSSTAEAASSGRSTTVTVTDARRAS